MGTKIIFGLFSLLLLFVGIVYITTPTLRDATSELFSSLYSAPTVTQPVTPGNTVTEKQVVTATTTDTTPQSNKRITYTLRYPADTVAIQHQNNNMSEITLLDSSETIVLTAYYDPRVMTLDTAWEDYFSKELKTLDKTAVPQHSSTPVVVIPDTEMLYYTFAGKDFAIARFIDQPQWFFVFDMRTTPQGKSLLSITETLMISSLK